MASLPHQFPQLALHLTDNTRTPILSSASANGTMATTTDATCTNTTDSSYYLRAQALDLLAETALRARTAGSRLNLGRPIPRPNPDSDPVPAPSPALSPEATALPTATSAFSPPDRIIVSYNTGAVMIESFLDPRPHQKQLHQKSHRQSQSSSSTSNQNDRADGFTAPSLLALVVSPGSQAATDARQATTRLERVGRALQHELAAQGQQQQPKTQQPRKRAAKTR